HDRRARVRRARPADAPADARAVRRGVHRGVPAGEAGMSALARDLALGALAAVLIVAAPALLSLVTYDACRELHDEHDDWPDVEAMHARAEGMEWALAAEAVRLAR